MIYGRLAMALIGLLVATNVSSANKEWIDVTQSYITNPGYDDNQTDGWTWTNSGNCNTRCECMEVWNGTFDIHQTIKNAPQGKYRLSVQAYFRTGDNNWAYQDYVNHQESITAYLYADKTEQKLVSVYSASMTQDIGNCFESGGKYFPNGMESARIFFDNGKYWNTIEFETGGDFDIGLKCSKQNYSSWAIWDNWKLEYYGDSADIFGYKATEGSLIINEIMASNVDEFLSPAFNYDGWMELYNPTDKAVELAGLQLSAPDNGEGPWTMPKSMGVVPAKGFRVVWFDSNDIASTNAPFKLDTDGGSILITDENGNEIVSQQYPASMERISYARTTDGTGDWAHTGTATPGASNNGIKTASTQLSAPVVDQPSQLFSGELNVQVTIPANATLYYTNDGTLPSPTNGQQSSTGNFTVSKSTALRFRLFADDRLPSPVTSRSYILKDKEYTLPVVALVTNWDDLYSKEYGIAYNGVGPNGRAGNGQSSKRNYNMNWERPANFSYILNGDMAINQDVNLEVSGGWSRANEQKSYKLKGNKELGGNKNLNYPFFGAKPYIRNRTLVARNGGNDEQGRFKDPALQSIIQASEVDIDCQSYEPVHEFINGEYQCVFNLREPNNKHYVYANYGWDDDVIDQFEMSPDSGYVQMCGTKESFTQLLALSENASNATTYTEIGRLLDIDAYINYMAAEFYMSHWDWPQNNVKGFRYRDGGKYRFVVFDLDNALSDWDVKIWGTPPFETFFNKENYTFDQLYGKALKTYGNHISANIEFVTLFRNMLQNDSFRRQFIDAYCLMGGSVFQKDQVNNVLTPLVERVKNWTAAEQRANEIKSWLGNHLGNATTQLKNNDVFKLKNVSSQRVTLGSDTKGATILVNGQAVPTGKFDGNLFAPVTLQAIAPAGYVFSGWKNQNGTVLSKNADMSLPTGTVSLTACFTPLSDADKQAQGITPIRINEVSGANDSYIDEYGKKGDWLELYNTTDEDIDVEGMYLTDNLDKPTKYQITKGNTKAQTVIPAHGYLIVWCDNKRATTDNGLHASFKISDDGGKLQLMAADKSWTDVITYSAHDANTTIVRYPDGTSDVYATNVPTIGHSNVKTNYMIAVSQKGKETGIATYTAADNHLTVRYVTPQIILHSEDANAVDCAIYTADGRQVMQTSVSFDNSETVRVDVSHLSPGFYVARAKDHQGRHISCKFMR